MSAFVVRAGVVLLGIIVGVGVFVIPYLNSLTDIQRISEVKINDQIIIAEVVKDERDRARGLSGRESLGINEGMLFLFEDTGRYGFWMKDMRFPIDIVWISDQEIVGFEENVEPEQVANESELTLYYPPEAVDKVLELKAGRARILRVKVGDVVKIRPLVPRL